MKGLSDNNTAAAAPEQQQFRKIQLESGFLSVGRLAKAETTLLQNWSQNKRCHYRSSLQSRRSRVPFRERDCTLR